MSESELHALSSFMKRKLDSHKASLSHSTKTAATGPHQRNGIALDPESWYLPFFPPIQYIGEYAYDPVHPYM